MQDEHNCWACNCINTVDVEWDQYTCKHCGSLNVRNPGMRRIPNPPPSPSERTGGDGQVGGSHYAGKLDPLALIRCMESSGNAYLDFCRGNVIKYPFRVKEKKDSVDRLLSLMQDLKKAKHYAELGIEQIEKLLAEK